MKLEIDAERQRLARDTTHDRLSVLRDAHRTLISLADGADGSRGAQSAAAYAVEELARCFRNGSLPEDPRDWVMILETIDRILFSDPDVGETSALVMLVRQGVVVGASVGDSLAYVVPPVGEPQLLTSVQHKGPGIGSGIARPIGFGPTRLDGKLITRRAQVPREERAAPAAVLATPPRQSSPPPYDARN